MLFLLLQSPHLRIRAPLSEPGSQGEHQIEHDAHAGEVLARKAAARLVGIDDGGSARQCVPGQVMIGDDDLDPERSRRLHAFDAGDAIVHGDDDIGPMRRGQGDDLGRQAVAGAESVGNEPAALSAECSSARTPTAQAGAPSQS